MAGCVPRSRYHQAVPRGTATGGARDGPRAHQFLNGTISETHYNIIKRVLFMFNSHAVAVRYSLRRRCVPLRYIFSFNSLSIFYFSRIKSVLTGLLRNSLRFSQWSPFVCRWSKRGPRVPKRMVYFRKHLAHEIRRQPRPNPKVSFQVQLDSLYIF